MAQVIFRRGGWYSDFRSGGRRIRRFLSKDRREAQIELGKLLAQSRAEMAGRPHRGIPWADFKTRYLAYCVGSKRPNSVIRDKIALSALESYTPISGLAQLTPEFLEQWKAARLAKGKGKATVARDINAIKALLNKATAWGYTNRLDWAAVRPPKSTRRKLYFHSPEDLGRLLARCHGVWRTVCLLGARAGLRREEMRMLTWDDVDLQRGRLSIVPKEGWEPKDYEQRHIPLDKDLKDHLETVRKATRSRWVLTERNGSRPGLSVMTAYFRKLAKKARVRGALHILRHTFASHLAQAGVPLKTIKDLLGHSDMATTEIYAELMPQNYEDAVAKLPHLGSASGFQSKRL